MYLTFSLLFVFGLALSFAYIRSKTAESYTRLSSYFAFFDFGDALKLFCGFLAVGFVLSSIVTSQIPKNTITQTNPVYAMPGDKGAPQVFVRIVEARGAYQHFTFRMFNPDSSISLRRVNSDEISLFEDVPQGAVGQFIQTFVQRDPESVLLRWTWFDNEPALIRNELHVPAGTVQIIGASR